MLEQENDRWRHDEMSGSVIDVGGPERRPRVFNDSDCGSEWE